MRKHINRKDSNHHEIVKEFRKLGWFVTDVSDVPKICDIRIDKLFDGYPVSVVVEIKDGEKVQSNRKITKDEFEYLSNFPGNIAIMESIHDCGILDLQHLFAEGKVLRYKFDLVVDRGIKK